MKLSPDVVLGEMIRSHSGAEIEKQLCSLCRPCLRRKRLGVHPHESNEVNNASLVAPVGTMELPLLLSSTRLIPNTIEQALIELMRCKTIPLQAIKRKRIHARARGNQHHEGNQLLCAGRDISGLVTLPDLPDILFRRSQDLPELLYRKRSGFCPVTIGTVKQTLRSPKERIEFRCKGPLRFTQEQAQVPIHGGGGLSAQSAARNQPNGVFLQYVCIEVLATSTSGMLSALLSRNA